MTDEAQQESRRERAEIWARFAAGSLAHGKNPSLAVKDADETLHAYDERFPAEGGHAAVTPDGTEPPFRAEVEGASVSYAPTPTATDDADIDTPFKPREVLEGDRAEKNDA
jgi:hypothetical protein